MDGLALGLFFKVFANTTQAKTTIPPVISIAKLRVPLATLLPIK